jgi:hypothetical protein
MIVSLPLFGAAADSQVPIELAHTRSIIVRRVRSLMDSGRRLLHAICRRQIPRMSVCLSPLDTPNRLVRIRPITAISSGKSGSLDYRTAYLFNVPIGECKQREEHENAKHIPERAELRV